MASTIPYQALPLALSINQGEDYIIEIPVLDANSVAVDLSTASKVRALLFVNNIQVAKYSRDTLVGYGSILMGNGGGTVLNVVRILARRADTCNFTIGVLTCALLLDVPDTDLGTRTAEVDLNLGFVIAGNTRSEVLT
jgi:hypothetical protein